MKSRVGRLWKGERRAVRRAGQLVACEFVLRRERHSRAIVRERGKAAESVGVSELAPVKLVGGCNPADERVERGQLPIRSRRHDAQGRPETGDATEVGAFRAAFGAGAGLYKLTMHPPVAAITIPI